MTRAADWIILRCGSGSTLRLAQSLAEAGFTTWSPMSVMMKQWPRSTVTREVAVPMLAGLVFAPSEGLDDLTALSHSPALTYQVWDAEKRRFVTRGHPYFTVFRLHGRTPVISEGELSSLRQAEAKLRALAERQRELLRQSGPPPRFEAGMVVRVGGAFEGLDLIVEEANDGKLVKVTYPAWKFAVEMSAWDLHALGCSDR